MKYIITIFFFLASSSFLFAECKGKFLQGNSKDKTVCNGLEQIREYEVKKLAEKLVLKQEKKDLEKTKKKLEEKKIALQKRLAKLESQKVERQEKFLRKAEKLENKRRVSIRSWRNYLNKKRAALCLIKAVKSCDLSNKLHVSELQDEIEIFSNKRLKGKISSYSELEKFLDI